MYRCIIPSINSINKLQKLELGIKTILDCSGNGEQFCKNSISSSMCALLSDTVTLMRELCLAIVQFSRVHAFCLLPRNIHKSEKFLSFETFTSDTAISHESDHLCRI